MTGAREQPLKGALSSTTSILIGFAKSVLNSDVNHPAPFAATARATISYAKIGEMQRQLQTVPNLERMTGTLHTALDRLKLITTPTAKQSYDTSKTLTDPLFEQAKQHSAELQNFIVRFNEVSSTVLARLRNILQELEKSAEPGNQLGSQPTQNQFKDAETQTNSSKASLEKLIRELKSIEVKLMTAYNAIYQLMPPLLQSDRTNFPNQSRL